MKSQKQHAAEENVRPPSETTPSLRPLRRRPVFLYLTVTALLSWVGFMIAMIWL